jgi:hypothetical protein
MRKFLIAAVLGLAALGFAGVDSAQAHPPRRHGGFGNGWHDVSPHWHRTQTPVGNYYWFGNGPHDLRPHYHSYSPWSGLRSYSYTPFGRTTSYHGYPGYYGYPYGGYSFRFGWGW